MRAITADCNTVAAAVVVEFWVTINSAIWITVFGLLLLITNLFLVRVYGETEFTFSMLKIMLIIGINMMVWLMQQVQSKD